MPFFLQDPFNFNIEISVSWCGCRYHDPAGFMPRTASKSPGSPALIGHETPTGIATKDRYQVKGKVFGVAIQMNALRNLVEIECRRSAYLDPPTIR